MKIIKYLVQGFLVFFGIMIFGLILCLPLILANLFNDWLFVLLYIPIISILFYLEDES